VWTGDAKTFFYNPTSKVSVWEKPPEIDGRQDVDKMLTNTPPEVLKIRQQLLGTPAAPTAAGVAVNAAPATAAQTEGEEPPNKKIKTDGKLKHYFQMYHWRETWSAFHLRLFSQSLKIITQVVESSAARFGVTE
jgi:hypothetical protein